MNRAWRKPRRRIWPKSGIIGTARNERADHRPRRGRQGLDGRLRRPAGAAGAGAAGTGGLQDWRLATELDADLERLGMVQGVLPTWPQAGKPARGMVAAATGYRPHRDGCCRRPRRGRPAAQGGQAFRPGRAARRGVDLRLGMGSLRHAPGAAAHPVQVGTARWRGRARSAGAKRAIRRLARGSGLAGRASAGSSPRPQDAARGDGQRGGRHRAGRPPARARLPYCSSCSRPVRAMFSSISR